MENIREMFRGILEEEALISRVLSNPRNKSDQSYKRVNIKPLIIRDDYRIQFEYEYSNKVVHDNLTKSEALEAFYRLAHDEFRQVNIFTSDKDIEILISKKRKTRFIEKKPSKEEADLSHNRKKDYILEDGVRHDFLIRLGIMDKNGRVKPSRYDKFRQINRFLELVSDVLDQLDKKEDLRIIDFGCGKSYLTFALYYYLVELLGLRVELIGLDLKADVIKFCNSLAEDLDYGDLNFIQGDIRDFESQEDVDMVVTLHACDIATDAALVKAIGWQAQVILSVPCCQSEFYSKLDNSNLQPMLKHGIIKEKLASLVTDSLRGNVLEALGYNVQLVEFIDMEHTPKNTLIRAYRDPSINREEARRSYGDFKKFWNLENLFIDSELGKINIKL